VKQQSWAEVALAASKTAQGKVTVGDLSRQGSDKMDPPDHKVAKFGYTLIAFCVTAYAVLLKWRSGFIPQ
jgi:hypothetical protein